MLEEFLLSDLLSLQSFLVEKLASRPQSDTWSETRMSENASETVWDMEVEVWKLQGCSKQVLLYANHPSKIDHSFISVNSDKIRTNSDVWSTTRSGLVVLSRWSANSKTLSAGVLVPKIALGSCPGTSFSSCGLPCPTRSSHAKWH